MSEAASWWPTGGMTMLGAVGGFLANAFVSRKKDAGQLALEQVKVCLAEIATLKSENAHCSKRLPVLEMVLRLTLPELQRAAPYSTALQQARDLLGEAFPIHLNTPPDMMETLSRLDDPAPRHILKDEI